MIKQTDELLLYRKESDRNIVYLYAHMLHQSVHSMMNLFYMLRKYIKNDLVKHITRCTFV